MKKPCVVIPTYNEARNIAAVIGGVKKLLIDVVVVDDGSSDASAQIARSAGAVVLKNQTNQGKGASLIKAFAYALQNDYDAVITMDGDGQHLPEDIPAFLEAAKTSDKAILIGNRMNETRRMPPIRYLTNRFMSWLLSAIAHQKIADSQCGFRLIKRSALEKLELKSMKYEIESELLVRASRLGFKIESIPIKTVYNGEKSQINPFIDTLRFIKFVIRVWIMRS